MILVMIYGHMPHFPSERLNTVIHYLFFYFMAWFFFKGGMFYKDKGVKTVIMGGVKRLLLPYCFFSVIGHCCWCVHLYATGDSCSTHYFLTPIKDILLTGSGDGNKALWYLSSLFLVRCLFSILRRIKISTVLIVFFSTIATMGLFYIKSIFSLPSYPYYLYNSIAGLFFFACGHLLKEKQFASWVFSLSIAFHTVILSYNFSTVSFGDNRLEIGYYYIWLLDAIACIIIVNNIIKYIMKIVPLRLLSFIGRNSMSFYVMHWPILIILNTACVSLEWSAETKFVCYALILAITLTICNIILHKEKFRFIIGE